MNNVKANQKLSSLSKDQAEKFIDAMQLLFSAFDKEARSQAIKRGITAKKKRKVL
jgi:hypothetical protein